MSRVESNTLEENSSEAETENSKIRSTGDDKGLEDTSNTTPKENETNSYSKTENDSNDDTSELSLCESSSDSFLRSDTDIEESETSLKQEDTPCVDSEHPLPITFLSKFNCFGWCKRRRKEDRVTEYWLISVPKEDDTWERLTAATSELSQNFIFHIPVLKVGTQDLLLSLLQRLKTLDGYVKDATVMLCKYIKEEIYEKYGKHCEDRIAEQLKVKNMHPVTYLTRFTWNKMKYPTWHTLPSIADRIYSEVDKINKKFKEKMDYIKDLKGKLNKYERRHDDNLRKRYLGDIVKKEHFVLDSIYLTTLLVVVPNKKERLWLNTYTQLSDMVVPNSSTKIFDNGIDSLFNVTLTRNCVDDFKSNAKETDFTVLNYEYSETEQISEQESFDHMSEVQVRQLANISKWTNIMFSECFEAWVHVLALRVFVESVLRFGIPINYQAAIVTPLKSKKKLKNTLNKLYDSVDTELAKGRIEDIPGGLTIYAVEEYYPYVFFRLDLRFVTW